MVDALLHAPKSLEPDHWAFVRGTEIHAGTSACYEERVALGLQLLAIGENGVEPGHGARLRVHREPGSPEQIKGGGLMANGGVSLQTDGGSAGRRLPSSGRSGVPAHDLVGEDRQRPAGSHLRVALAERPGGGIARVCKEPVLGSLLASVQLLESHYRQVHLAAHLQVGGELRLVERQLEGHVLNRPHVVGDVLPDTAVTSCRSAHEATVVVGDGDREPVYLRLANEPKLLGLFVVEVEQAFGTRSPGQEVIETDNLVEAHHRHPVGRLGEQGGRRSADRLSRGLLDHELRVGLLDGAQLVYEQVVVRVGNLRIVELVVAVGVIRDQASQLPGTLGRTARRVGADRRVGVASGLAHGAVAELRAVPEPSTSEAVAKS